MTRLKGMRFVSSVNHIILLIFFWVVAPGIQAGIYRKIGKMFIYEPPNSSREADSFVDSTEAVMTGSCADLGA